MLHHMLQLSNPVRNRRINNNLKDAIESARTEELKEDQDVNRRSNNVIIHGVKHQSNENLQEWIKEFTNDTHTNVTVKHISRIGKDTNKQPKPLIVVLKNEDEKEKLLSNLTAVSYTHLTLPTKA